MSKQSSGEDGFTVSTKWASNAFTIKGEDRPNKYKTFAQGVQEVELINILTWMDYKPGCPMWTTLLLSLGIMRSLILSTIYIIARSFAQPHAWYLPWQSAISQITAAATGSPS